MPKKARIRLVFGFSDCNRGYIDFVEYIDLQPPSWANMVGVEILMVET